MQMSKMKTTTNIVLIIMILLSITPFFGLNIAGISVALGVIYFILEKRISKRSAKDSGFDIRAVIHNLKGIKIWLLILLPILFDIFAVVLSKAILPDYVPHVISRSGNYLSFDKVISLAIQLVIFAVGEEIAWRAFFQHRAERIMPVIPAIAITSVLFSFGHLASGDITIVIYDILFVFLNSVVYGVVYHKTQNAWISAISHLLSNIFSLGIIFFL